ncbi:MAG: antibiotic biosynthesis monooxygenase [Propionivibrio sp.]
MIVEYIRYQLAEHTPDTLREAYSAAGAHLQAAPECHGYELSQCAEDANSLILRILWSSGEAHMQGFRTGPHFPPFLALVRPFLNEVVEMRHYNFTPVQWAT